MNCRFAIATCAASFVAVTLQGCGGGGDATTSTKPPTTTTNRPTTVTTTTTNTPTTVTTTTTHAPWKPAVPDIDAINSLYMGYNPATSTENFGVPIRFVAPSHAKDGFWFYCGTPCYQGHCDCRLSGAVLNNKVLVKDQGGKSYPAVVYQQPTIGVMFNVTKVEKEIAKCYYQFDGATDLRYNMGCGCGVNKPEYQSCDSDYSPYHNKDPTNDKPMTDKSRDVSDCHCGDGARAGDPTETTDSQCYWKGPAFYPPDPSANKNEIKNMFDDRMKNNDGVDPTGNPPHVHKESWNEVVIDGELFLDEVAKDPSQVIQAVIWTKTGDAASDKDLQGYANDLAGWFKENYRFTENVAVVALDVRVDVSGSQGPFTMSTEESVVV